MKFFYSLQEMPTIIELLILLGFLMGIFLFNKFSFALTDMVQTNTMRETDIESKVINNTKTKDNIRLEDRVIGYTFKTMAKAFVLTMDINRLKKDNIEKLNKMDEERFRKQYAKAYRVIRGCTFLATRYGIAENMPKEQAIKKIQSLNKKEIYEIIDTLPDTVIANQFKQYLKEKKQEILKNNVFEQINQVWNKIIKKVK